MKKVKCNNRKAKESETKIPSSKSLLNTQNSTLPEGWVWVRLGEIAEIYTGYGFPKNLQGKERGKYPFFKVGDISKNVVLGYKFLEFCENYIDDDDLNKLKAKPYPKGTIVFAKIGEALKLNRRAILKKEGLVDNNAIGVKAIENICCNNYFFYFLNTVKLEDYSRATTVPSVRKSDIELIPLPLPSLPEQHRIVAKIEELFTKLDAGVDALKKAKEQIKRYRQAVLKYAFEGKLTEEWRKTNMDKLESACVLLERIKEERKKKLGKKYKELPPIDTSELPELPEGWVWVRLGEIAEIISGVSFKPNQLCKQDVKSVRILRGGNIQNDNYYLLEDDYFVPKDIVSNVQLLRRYDIILVSSTGSKQAIGKAAIIKEELNNLSVGAFLRIIRIYENIQKKYIGFYFYTLSYRNYIREIVKGVNINNIKDSYLNEMFLPLPPLPEQQRIVEEIERRFSVADEVEKVIDNSLKQAERLRQSILKKAFEGKLVPQDPNDEPAEKLLKRIMNYEF